MMKYLSPVGAIVSIVLAVIAMVSTVERVATLEHEAANTNTIVMDVRASYEISMSRARGKFAELDDATALCVQRTESLRGVLEVLIPSGVWPDRVRLPDPPPGWAPWPEGNKYGIER